MNTKKEIKIAIQMDTLDKINKETDSTLALIEEALKKKFSIFIYSVENLYLEDNNVKAIANKVVKIEVKNSDFMKIEKDAVINLKFFDFILVRQDPPFDMQYITATYLLERLPSSCLILNHPKSIRDCPEKLFVLNFVKLMPPTIIIKNKKIVDFVKKYKKVVIKPLYGNGGENVFYLSEKDPNFNIIIDNLILGREHMIVQKYINKVKFGDKRILLINGNPVGAVNRIPTKNEIRANLHIGGRAQKTKLTKKELHICEKIKDKVVEKKLFFAGIDIIDGYLTEINVTSPTCIREINYLNKTNISEIFWTEALRLFYHRSNVSSSQ